MASNSKSVPRDLGQREAELRRAESEIAAQEDRLLSEAAAASESVQSLKQRLAVLKTQAGQLREAGQANLALPSLLARLEATEVPERNFGSWQERSFEARVAALEARSEASQQLKQEISALQSQLGGLVAQLNSDEESVKTFQNELQQQKRAAQQAQKAEVSQQPPGMRAAVPLPATKAPPPRRPPPLPDEVEEPVVPIPLGQMIPPAGRQLARVKMQTVVDIGSDSNFFQGFSTNLSEGGLFVATVKTVPPGTEVDLHFTLPGGRKIQVKGVVRWYREVNDQNSDIYPGVGVQFVDLSPSDATAIREFVSTREPMFFAT